jgi:glutamate carboxypeptidase
LHVDGEFLPLVQDAAAKVMFSTYQEAAADSGLAKLSGEFAGGCADSGFTASVGTPTLCGLGPVGGNVHTDLEWLDIDSIVPRAQTLARAILRSQI